MAVCFWYPIKSVLPSIHVYSSVHCTSHVLQCTRKTRPYLTGHPVAIKLGVGKYEGCTGYLAFFISGIWPVEQMMRTSNMQTFLLFCTCWINGNTPTQTNMINISLMKVPLVSSFKSLQHRHLVPGQARVQRRHSRAHNLREAVNKPNNVHILS